MNPQRMTMVVARYDEDLDWLQRVPWDYIVYNKGGDYGWVKRVKLSDTETYPVLNKCPGLPAWIKNEIKLPNIDHEGHTYLTHIIDNYDNLPEYTIFVQGNPFDHSRNFMEKINAFSGGAGFFPLSNLIMRIDKYGMPTEPGLRIYESAEKIFLKNDIEFFEYPSGAQFIVSKKAIRFHTKMTYQKIRDFVIEAQPTEEDYKINKKDPGYTKLFSGWVMEVLWKTLFDGEHKTVYD